MSITSTEQANGIQVTQPILQANTEFRATYNLACSFVRAAQPGPRHVGYGLPCCKCGTYYMADLSVCPICKCGERISPTTLPAWAGLQNAQPIPEGIQVTAISRFPLQPGTEPSGWPRTSSDLQTLL